MIKEYKDKWVAALPQYAQTKGRLHDAAGFCCLGVLCDIIRKERPEEFEWVEMEKDRGEPVYKIQLRGSQSYATQWGGLLPTPIAELVGLDSQDPPIFIGDRQGFTLSGLNDGGWTFAEIAKMIEEQL